MLTECLAPRGRNGRRGRALGDQMEATQTRVQAKEEHGLTRVRRVERQRDAVPWPLVDILDTSAFQVGPALAEESFDTGRFKREQNNTTDNTTATWRTKHSSRDIDYADTLVALVTLLT